MKKPLRTTREPTLPQIRAVLGASLDQCDTQRSSEGCDEICVCSVSSSMANTDRSR